MKLFSKRVIQGPDSTPYMVRRIIFRCRWFGIHLHHILRSDSDRALHDHPWSFVSVILWGGYWEWVDGDMDGRVYARVGTWKCPGSVLIRRAEHAHRVTLDRPCWSLVFTGPRRRTWGFYGDSGWLPWREYLGLDERAEE